MLTPGGQLLALEPAPFVGSLVVDRITGTKRRCGRAPSPPSFHSPALLRPTISIAGCGCAPRCSDRCRQSYRVSARQSRLKRPVPRCAAPSAYRHQHPRPVPRHRLPLPSPTPNYKQSPPGQKKIPPETSWVPRCGGGPRSETYRESGGRRSRGGEEKKADLPGDRSRGALTARRDDDGAAAAWPAPRSITISTSRLALRRDRSPGSPSFPAASL